MSQTVSSAVATKSKAAGMIEQYRGDFATVLPSHVKPATWVRLAQGALRRDVNLQRAAEKNPGSFLSALLEAARLGLEPGSEHYYLVPFGSEVTGIVGYQGEIELMYRAGAVTSIKAELVHERDHFAYEPGSMDRPDHRPDWFGDRGPIVGAYAYAEMIGGTTSRVIVMNKQQIEDVRASSPSGRKSGSPWDKWWDRMALKTVLHQLAKFVPTSAEYRREQLRAAVEADNLRSRPPEPTTTPDLPHVNTDTGEVVDAELVEGGDTDAQEQLDVDWRAEARQAARSGQKGDDA